MIPKFRAWHTKINEFVRPDKYAHIDKNGELSSPYCVLMQSTGLFDKNGVEIFEGDILHLFETDWLAFVLPLDSGHGHRTQSIGMNRTDLLLFQRNDARIIGNIHQSPELLIPT